LQIPCNHPAIFDVERAAASQTYCDEVRGILAEHGLAISELSTHLEGQLVAVHPAYDAAFDAFAPPRCAAIRRRASVGGGESAPGGGGLGASGAEGACDLFRGAGMALFLSVAAA
jgi:sugar phosphate isomerase/epimerase